MIIVITTAITYTSFSMNQMSQLSETIGIKQTTDYERTTEEFKIVKVRTDNNQFNMTIKNTGDTPVHLTRLWVENTTDSSWPISRYDLDISVPVGGTVQNIGQNIGLTAIDSQSYAAQLVTSRGNAQQMFLNAVGDSTVYLRLTATPSVLPETFSSNVALEVINTGTTQLLNLQPNMISVVKTCLSECDYVEEQAAIPTSFDSLAPGDTAVFEWVYSFTGENSDTFDFTAGLTNDLRNDTFTVSLQTIQSSLNADVAVESGGLGNQQLINDDILLFHAETDGTPLGEYQMWSGLGDGGGNGDRIELDQETPVFFTNNGSTSNTIPLGSYNVALMISSESIPRQLIDNNKNPDMIFHFEDGVGANPDNSQGDADRDLEACGATTFQERIQSTNDDAEQASSGSVDLSSSSDHELVYDGNYQWIGLRWNLDVPQGATINSADIRFRSDENQNGNSPTLRIGAEDVDNANAFSTTSHDVDDRWDGGSGKGPVTSATVAWNNIPGWSNNEEGSDTTTPDLSTIIQEIVNRPSWLSGNGIAFIIRDDSGGTDSDRRTAEHYDAGGPSQAARLTVNWGGATGTPTWDATGGPHNSGTYKFDGNDDCFRSINNVSGGEDNNIAGEDDTTSLWFKTDGPNTEEQMLVFWSGGGTYPTSSDHYLIALDAAGNIKFEFQTGSGSDTSVCTTTNADYDDSQWHHVIAVRGDGNRDCNLYVTDVNGNVEEEIDQNYNWGTSSVDVGSTQWYVGSNQGSSNFFKGWIDDVMHWNDDILEDTIPEPDVDALRFTNYGDNAHRFDLSLDETNALGLPLENWYNETNVPVPFVDPKGGGNNDDWAYAIKNMTFSLPQKVVDDGNRLKLSFTWKASTATLESLEVDMKIDDTDMVTPYPSFMQIPFPEHPFPTYYTHDNDDHFDVFAANTGNDGIFLIYQGTRINFNGTGGAYASLVDTVNASAVTEHRDSIYIPPGQLADLDFYVATNIPSTNAQGDKITPGLYRTTIWINGYSDQGETFSRSVPIGTIIVVE